MAGKIKVPSELVPSQSNKVMLRSKYIYDDIKGHTQEEVNAALEEQIESKVIAAGGVNWDTVPTAGSNNAVKSKDIKAALEKVTGYFVLDSNVLESTVAKTVTVADFPALAIGGSIKIKMLTKNTATNPTLRIGPASATAYPLYYNEERASASNSWEENEIISVFFDGTNYRASNSQGGGGSSELKRLRGHDGFRISLDVGIGNVVGEEVQDNNITYTEIAVNEGDVLRITAQGGTVGRAWGFIDENRILIDVADNSGTRFLEDKILIVPENVDKVVLNNIYITTPGGTPGYPNYKWYYAKAGSLGTNILLAGNAKYTVYDNSESDFSSTNVQGALDEIKPMFEHLDDVPVDFGTMSNSAGDFTWVQGNVESGQINPNYKNAYTIFSIDDSSTLMEITFTLPASHTAVLYYYTGNKYISTGVKNSASFNPQKYGYFTYLLQVTKDYPSHADFNKVSTMNLTVHTVSYNSYIPNTQYRILALEAKVPDIDEAYNISISSVVGNNIAHITTKAHIFANTDMEKVYYRVNGNIWNREWIDVIRNPVMLINFPDPTIIKVGNYYYMAATVTRIALYKSTDLANWEYVKRIIPSDFDYSQVNNVTSFWAPELAYIDGRYVCFISANTENSDRFTFSMIADDIEGDWEFNSITVSIAGRNQIDPAYAEENDVKYIFCGSWSGIYRYVLDDETLAATDEGTQVVRTNIEATVLYKYGDYWYMFTSSGDTFTYSYCIHIARSATLDGTFVNKNGQSSVNAAGTKILSSASTDILLGPGHPSNVITVNGKMYMLFHNMIKGLEGSGTNAIRYPMLMRIVEGSDGWLAFADKDGNVVTKPTWETTVM